MRFSIALLAWASLCWHVAAQDDKTQTTFECRQATGKIDVDGKADEAAWQKAELIANFRQPWLKENAKPVKTSTKARLLWDDEFLYFHAELEDHDLFADILEHDGRTWLNDVFEIFFRPDENKPPYYELQVNPAGTELDIFFQRKGVPFDQAKVDGEFHWKTAVVRRGTLDNRSDRDEGWSAEGRIPWGDFSRTGGRPKSGDVWRFALCRYDYTLNEKPETSTCAPLSQPSFHLLEDYARLKFIGRQVGGTGVKKVETLTTSKVVGSPDPPPPYRPVRAFPKVKLSFPIALDRIPGTTELLVIVQDKSYGPASIIRIKDDAEVSVATPVLTTPAKGTAYGIAFHPQFATKGLLYVGWNGAPDGGTKRTFITRYTMDLQSLAIDETSALDVISWESNGHNGGDLEFGLDGMLYVTSGDGTSDSDTNLRGQDLTQLTSKVLRINVDRPANGKNYGIPSDNPFIGREDTAPETWAYGLRNPWRIAIDPKNGQVWVGNNGQDLWEQVYLIKRGENYGWSAYEGSHVFYEDRKMGKEPLAPPAAEHHHVEARSLTGGVVYHGEKLQELRGAYIYGDHSTGRIWGLRHDGNKATWHKLLADTTFNITGFALDSRGELLVADHRGEGEGGFYYLTPSPPASGDFTFPRKLSESGLFADVQRHSMAAGVVPYSVNSPLWSDGAHKQRFLAVPAHVAGEVKIDLLKKNGWDFPDETVLVKSFALELTTGDEKSLRWVETRFLTKQAGEWAGYSYAWNDEQTDAELVAAEGADRQFVIHESASVERPQTWHFPSRVECMVCHSRAANFVLGLSTAQMNRLHDSRGERVHQFHVLADRGWLKQKQDKEGDTVPWNDAKYPRLADPYDAAAPLEARARSYLHANCSICHISAGGGNAQIDLEYSASLKKLNAIDVVPLHHKFGLEDARLIASGHPERSVLLHRLAHRGPGSGQMPQLSTNVIDERAVLLFEDWIRSLK